MSTANFNNNQLGFPLYCREDFYSKVCPECGCWNMESAETCEDCGESLENVEARYDELDNEIYFDEVAHDLSKLSEDLEFFTVDAKGGYYGGVQFDVDWNGRIGDPEDLDNEDAHYFFGCCRSVMLRKYQRERRKLGKKLEELAEFHGFERYGVSAQFSNGETWYTKIEKPKKKKKSVYAVSANVNAPAMVSA